LKSGCGVFDAGPLISFHQTDTLWLPEALFEHVVVPVAVAAEVKRSLGLGPEWFEISSPRIRLLLPEQLGPGEREAIGLAMEIGSDFVVLDDLPARNAALAHGLPVVGTLGLLVKAKQRGLVSEVRPLMDAMVAAGHYASDRLQALILETAGEA
jgi:predicted nucleic acid-binding protein